MPAGLREGAGRHKRPLRDKVGAFCVDLHAEPAGELAHAGVGRGGFEAELSCTQVLRLAQCRPGERSRHDAAGIVCGLLAMVFGLIIGPADSPNRRRGSIIAGVAVALVVANFAYIYPVLTDQLMLYKDWLARMWLRSWI